MKSFGIIVCAAEDLGSVRRSGATGRAAGRRQIARGRFNYRQRLLVRKGAREAAATIPTAGRRKGDTVRKFVARRYTYASLALTRAETTVMSARPASLPFNAAMTLPMAAGPAAPVAAMASAIAASISLSASCARM